MFGEAFCVEMLTKVISKKRAIIAHKFRNSLLHEFAVSSSFVQLLSSHRPTLWIQAQAKDELCQFIRNKVIFFQYWRLQVQSSSITFIAFKMKQMQRLKIRIPCKDRYYILVVGI